MSKTTITLKNAERIWPVVEKWADAHDYTLDKSEESHRLYHKANKEGGNIHVEISLTGQDWQLSAWYSDLLRKEMEIDTPNPYAALPRKEALAEIKDLLAGLGYKTTNKAKSKKKEPLAFKLGRSLRNLTGKK
jgi:hypothetical protein